MIIKLIPVIELPTDYLTGQPANDNSLKFSFEETTFVLLSTIPDEDLSAIVLHHTEAFRTGKIKRSEATSLWGGFILQIDGKDSFFPQCCSDLSDIEYWNRISQGKQSVCEGHPSPLVRFKDDFVLLDCNVGPHDEPFRPAPAETILRFYRLSLINAVAFAKEELTAFEKRLIKLNEQEKWGIENIGRLLIWDNANYD